MKSILKVASDSVYSVLAALALVGVILLSMFF